MKDLEIMASATNTVIQEDDSMSPNIAKGSIIFLEPFTENNFCMCDGVVYVFKTPKGLITRRYVFAGMDEVELRPANKEYKSTMLKISEMIDYVVMGRVTGRFTKL